jgi:hypothetical protein
MRGVTDHQPILIVLHQETSSPGRVGKVLEARGFPLDIRRPPLGDDLPETLEHHSGAVVFGGPMSANDDHDYVRRETDWLAVPLAENKPLLGICLGAQMLVNHLGGEVKEHPDGLVEIGWYPIRPTEEGERLMAWPVHDLPVSPRRLQSAGWCSPSGYRGFIREPGLPLWRKRVGRPVPCRTDAGDDASLGSAWRAPFPPAWRAGRPAAHQGQAALRPAGASPGSTISSTWFSCAARSSARGLSGAIPSGAGSAHRAVAGT